MLWRELLDLEPDLIEIEAWVRTLDPFEPQVMQAIEERLRPLIGWHRDIPGVEVVPFDEPWPSIRDRKEHDQITGNNRRRHRFFNRLPLPARLLYTSEAWDAALHHLTIVLRARRRELEELSSTAQGEQRTINEEPPMFEEDMASTGHMTVADMRKKLRGLPGNAVIHLNVEGYTPSPITDFFFQKPDHPDEGEVGCVMLSMDPCGEIGRTLVDQEPIKTKFVQTVTVIDPDTGGEVQVEIRKLESGGMVGIDGSWLEADERPTYSPFDKGVQLVIPDDEQE